MNGDDAVETVIFQVNKITASQVIVSSIIKCASMVFDLDSESKIQ